MADQDDLYYLQPGFDLTTLTVPRLRSILVEHDLSYPSSAKKSDLVEIIRQQLLPQARKLIRHQARVRRTSKGITDVPSSQEEVLDGDASDDKELMPPPPAPRTPRSRKSKSTLRADESDTAPSTTRRSKTPTGRKKTSRTPRASDTEPDGDAPRPSVRRGRKSAPVAEPVTQTPSVRIQDAPNPRASRNAGDSPFTQDNPFQASSSPPSGSGSGSGSRRISSTSGSKRQPSSTSRKSTSRRREAKHSSQVKRETSPSTSRSTYEFPVSKLSTGADGLDVTEEFTPTAKEELDEDMVSDRRLAKTRQSALMRHKKKPTSTASRATPIVIITTILVGIAGWYRGEKIAVGYCGVGQPSWSLADNPNIPVWVHESLQPQCEPCPNHAICFPNMEVKCEDDFVLQQHPLYLNGLAPLPPTCEPDSEKERRIKAVADRAVEELREQRAAYECGEESKIVESSPTNTIAATTRTRLEVSEETLKRTVSKMRRRGMTPDEFEDLWRGALDDITSRDEVEVTRDGSGNILLSSSSLARLSFTCAVRRSLLRAITQNRLPIGFVILVLVSLGYGRKRLIGYSQSKAQVPGLVAMALDRLATQATLKEEGRVGEAFISVGQLRDDVLRHVFSMRERERVWQRVRAIVESNSNIRAATREGTRTGEWSRVWEWIGPVDLTLHLDGSRRRSGGLQIEGASSNDGTPQQQERGGDRSNLELRRWDEGRAVY